MAIPAGDFTGHDEIDAPFKFGNERTVKVTFLPHVVVSTARLSVDHSFGNTPLWYETMVFPHNGKDVVSYGELDSDRYTTEEQAREGHESIVQRWRSRVDATAVWEDENNG